MAIGEYLLNHQAHKPIPWRELRLIDIDSNEIGYHDEHRHPMYLQKLQEFRDSEGMRDMFFARLDWPHEDSKDASTWGPQHEEDVDWTGFPESA